MQRDRDGGTSGIYRCDIETIAVNNNNVSVFVCWTLYHWR